MPFVYKYGFVSFQHLIGIRFPDGALSRVIQLIDCSGASFGGFRFSHTPGTLQGDGGKFHEQLIKLLVYYSFRVLAHHCSFLVNDFRATIINVHYHFNTL